LNIGVVSSADYNPFIEYYSNVNGDIKMRQALETNIREARRYIMETKRKFLVWQEAKMFLVYNDERVIE